MRAAVEIAIARRTDYRCEFRIRHPQRDERWMESHGRLVFDATGQLVCLSGLTLDIRVAGELQRLFAEEALREADRRKHGSSPPPPMSCATPWRP